MDRVDAFRISEADAAKYRTNEYQIIRWEISGVVNRHVITSSLPAETCHGTSLWNSNDLMVNRNGVSNGTNWSDDAFLNSRGTYLDDRVVSGEINSQGLQRIIRISSLASQKAGGNVHSGAPPPWFEATERDQLNDQLQQVSTGFVSSLYKPGKSKLNPKRVGAAWAERRMLEMEMEKRGEIVESDCDSNWLPNFGRV